LAVSLARGCAGCRRRECPWEPGAPFELTGGDFGGGLFGGGFDIPSASVQTFVLENEPEGSVLDVTFGVTTTELRLVWPAVVGQDTPTLVTGTYSSTGLFASDDCISATLEIHSARSASFVITSDASDCSGTPAVGSAVGCAAAPDP
jgi:hypothetical protein